MSGGGTVPFAVVYSDGDNLTDVDTVAVSPTLSFRWLLSLLIQKVGILVSQLSVFLANISNDRKIPLSAAKVNLATMPLNAGGGYYFAPNVKDSLSSSKVPPENAKLLRRGAAGGGGDNLTPLPALRLTYLAPPILDPVEYERNLRNLRKERESFLLNMGINRELVRREVPNGGGGEGSGAVCCQCQRAKLRGVNAGFHLCIHDKVVRGFRSTAGPISRPVKNSGKKIP